jgi:hypothetical protein
MPQDPSIRASRSPAPPGSRRIKLQPTAIESFLTYLFSDIARRPKKLRLSEAAAVARFLHSLSFAGVPNDVAKGGDEALQKYGLEQPEEGMKARACLEELSQLIWNTLFQCGEFNVANPHIATRFLETHRHTYLANSPVDEALELIKRRRMPTGGSPRYGPPRLRSRSRTVAAGCDNRNQPKDDLSERIFIADEALNWAGKKKRQPSIELTFPGAAKIRSGRARTSVNASRNLRKGRIKSCRLSKPAGQV